MGKQLKEFLEQVNFSYIPVKNSPMNKYADPERFMAFLTELDQVSRAQKRK